jgi:glycosyltransferase involved in cell wall biosynthesis
MKAMDPEEPLLPLTGGGGDASEQRDSEPVMRSRAADGRSVTACQGKRPDQRHLGGPQFRGPILSFGLPKIQKITKFLFSAPLIGAILVMLMLSAIVITRNEATNIRACLDSLAFCDERIVIDCGSTDTTAEIARERGARVELHEWCGYGPQKNYALSLATGTWVLSLDADERVTPELAAAIKSAIADAGADAWEIPRISSFCGRQMRHSGWYPDYVLRLFRRGKARFDDVIVHERVICDGVVKRLRPPLTHYPVVKLEDALSRMDCYSTAKAQGILASGRKVSFLSGIGHGLFSFLRTYVLKAGFLDGAEGFLLAVANAEGSYYPYMKAWLAMRERRSRNKGKDAPNLIS